MVNPLRLSPSRFKPRSSALSPVTIMYFGTSCETYIQSHQWVSTGKFLGKWEYEMNIYHRTTTNESKRTNMTELVDDRSSCCVCIVLRHSQREPNETMLLNPGLKCRHKEELTSTITWPARSVLLANMLRSPILQSWAMWQEPMIRLLSPITCSKKKWKTELKHTRKHPQTSNQIWSMALPFCH